MAKHTIDIKSAADLVMARAAGQLAAQVLHMIAEHVKPVVQPLDVAQRCAASQPCAA